MMSKAAPDTINEEGEGHAQIEAEVNDNDNGKGKTKDIANGAAAERERTEDDAKVDADGDTEVKVNAEAPPSLVLPPPDVKDTQPPHDDSGSKADGTVAAAAAIGGGPAATEKWLGATSPEERASTARALFSEIRDVKLYLCTDILLVATHERVSTIWGRAQEHVKAALQDAPPVRTTTIDDDGVETIHKVKFQRSEELDLITVSEFPDAAVLPHGFVIHFPEGPKYYKSTSAKDRDDFLDHFYNTTATLTETQSQRMAELKRVHGGPRP